jgi:hypothetical protein
VVQAKAIAKARGEAYQPEKHGPFEAKRAPRQERQKAVDEMKIDGDLEGLLARFRAKGGRHLKAEPRDRVLEVLKR